VEGPILSPTGQRGLVTQPIKETSHVTYSHPRHDRSGPRRVPAAAAGRQEAAHGCDYCLSAHTYLGRNVAKLDDAEITANRNGSSNDVKADAAVKFAVKVTQLRGHVTGADFAAVKAAGYTDAQIIEIVQHVALNTWTNYINTVGGTEIDFPVVKARKVA